jgi:hypothetical protein
MVPKKAMSDEVQEMHLQTLSAYFLLETSSRKSFPEIIFRDTMNATMMSASDASQDAQCCSSEPTQNRHSCFIVK